MSHIHIHLELNLNIKFIMQLRFSLEQKKHKEKNVHFSLTTHTKKQPSLRQVKLFYFSKLLTLT